MKKELLLEKSIKELGLDNSIINILNNHNIDKIRNLWELNRKSLKQYNLSDSDINQITIKLQLKGLDLNKRIY